MSELLQKPLTAYVRCIVDAEGFELDAVETREAVRQLNAYDALLAELTWVLAYIEHNAGGLLKDFDKARIRAAIAAAKPEPASRPDVSC
jgi:hypothetical protein